MKQSGLTRSLAMLLVLVMIVGMIPMQIFAAETEHEHEHETTIETATEPVTEDAAEAATEPVTESATIPVVDLESNAVIIPEVGPLTEEMPERDELDKPGIAPLAEVGTGPYKVENVRYESWDEAMAAAAAADTKVVTLVSDVTLAAGEYEVPAGVTLLVPYDAEGTLFTDTPGCLEDENLYTTPKPFRTLTLTAGANITVNGDMSVPAPHVPAQGSKKNGGSPTGSYGHVAMEAGSNIVVNSGANLYAWGYITGSGTVTAKAGASVHEYFQIMDFRGGSATMVLATNTYGVFPLNQYYVQNVEVPLVLEAGSAAKCYTSVKMSGIVLGSGITFIGNTEDAMFKLTSGKVTKYYDGNTDRLMAVVEGNMDISPIILSMSGFTVNSEFMVLPITNNITIRIKSGSSNITQDVALFPGSQMIIDSGATATLGNGVSVYIYDKDEWGNYAGSIAAPFHDLDFAPGKNHTRTLAEMQDASVQIDGMLDASKGFVYTTASGANVFSTGSGVVKASVGQNTATYQFEYNGDVTANYGIFHEIPVTPLQLKNADGTYLPINADTVAYTCVDGVWGACDHATTEIIPGTPPTCDQPGLTDGLKCAICGTILQSQYTDPAACQWGEGVVTTQPTCTEDGVRTFTCSGCGKTKTEAEPKLGHDIVTDVAVDATCTTTGLTEGSHCTRCDEMTEEQTVIPALDHDWDEGTVTTPATCTTTGESLHACSRCDATEKRTVDALGHDMIVEAAKPATCTEDGEQTGAYCSRCDYTEGGGVIPALGHDWDEGTVTTAATCTANGERLYHCSRCAETKTEVIPAGHDMAEATCTEPATCKRGCGYTEGKALGHDLVKQKAKEATCTEDGLTAGEYCKRCDYEVKQEVVKATGHDMAEATCTEPAICRNGCGHTEGKALGHIEIFDEEIPATCEDDGLTEGIHCDRCKADLLVPSVIPALGHDIIQVEAKLPTYSSVGWEAYERCTRCPYSTYVEIPKLEAPAVKDYETFLENLLLLEEIAKKYVYENPGKDPLALVIKYIRTGVDRYNSGSWGIMAGYEDAGFAAYVGAYEDAYNLSVANPDEMIAVTAMKDIHNFNLPNGDLADLGHVFGTMDITYHNNYSQNHADVAGWAGDTVDLVSLADQFGVSGTVEEMVTDITNNYLLKDNDYFPEEPIEGAFSQTDMIGDLDGLYIMQQLKAMDYKCGDLTALLKSYFTPSLTDEARAAYMLNNRLEGVSTRSAVRNAVWNAYSGNKVVTTLENTRNFNTENLTDLKKAACYAVADYLCRLAGDYVDVTTNPYYSVFSSETTILAPGITQVINYAMSADNKQMVYYLATADLPREDIQVYANYKDNDPTVWGMARVLDQANAAQEKYGNPESEYYIENYNVITSINADGYNMATGEPGGLLVMHGVEYHAVDGGGFFAILKDGTAMIGTQAEYEKYKSQIQEGVGGFGTTLVRDGEVVITATSNYYTDRASRTAVGITKTGKVVFMVLDGRQEPRSCGGSMIEIAQIMLEAGCIHAINLDGGGSTTYVAKQEGDDELTVVSRPSDGTARSVSTTLMMVSTAPNSTAFDHANLEASSKYLTVGSTVQVTASGVSATGNAAQLPEGTTWEVSDSQYGKIDANGVFTAAKNGDVEVYLMLGEEVIGSMTLHVVKPDRVFFSRPEIDAIYGTPVTLPVQAVYDGNIVSINPADVKMTLSIPEAGTISGFEFTGNEDSGIKLVKVTAALTADPTATASITVSLYNQGEATFDFDRATGGDRQLAWDRQVSNTVTDDAITYTVVNPDEDMVTSYIFAIDMNKIEIPEVLSDLTYMLPGADMENASAWTFLCQLAERMSDLTEVRPVIYFDPNMEVDYSGLTLVNEYFELGEVTLDEETNALTATLRWIKRSEPIDLAMANPICILSGLKLTPKDDAKWNNKDQLNVVNKGEIGYTVYMRANALYAFASKPENQAKYGLYPYVHPNNPNESGGCFTSVYKTFEDSYTLIKSVKNGWYNEDGGFAYYKNGQKYYGVQEVDGYYYDFGEDGINVGQTKYTGLFTNNGKTYCALNGKLVSGWQQINGAYYCFNGAGNAALTGEQTMKIGGKDITYLFAEDGMLTSGVWVHDSVGSKYYYGPACHKKGWQLIDGKSYFFENEYCYKGYHWIRDSNSIVAQWYDFGEDGALVEVLTLSGLIWVRDELYYLVDGVSQIGLCKIDGYFYYFLSGTCAAIRDGDYYITNLNGYNYTADNIQIGTYTFDIYGRMVTDKDVEFIGASLSLKGDIGLNFYVMVSDGIREDEDAYMKFIIGDTVKTVPMNQGILDPSDGSYRYSVALNAKNMGDEVVAQVFLGERSVGGTKTLSIKTYADYAIANSSNQKLVNLMKAMLNYGSAAQVEFGYKPDQLVNAGMSAADKALPANVDVSEFAHVFTGSQEGITVTSASLLLQSETKIRIYFEIADGKSVDDFTFTVDGKQVTPVKSGDEYYIEKANVAAKDLDTVYTFQMGGLTLTYSGMSYVVQVQKYSSDDRDLMNLAKSLYAYNQAANVYFSN